MFAMESESPSELTPIQKFYAGRSVFLTGATGLVGKVVLEKLLRSCPGIGQIYILMRSKRGKDTEERLQKILNSDLFEPLRKSFPDFHSKVIIVEGDLEQVRLGISDERLQEMQQNVSIVFHAAASINFKDPIKKIIQSNVIGTESVLDLCKSLPNIAAIVHVSTFYSHRDADCTVPEHVRKCHVTPKQLLDAFKWMDDKTLQQIEPFLVKENIISYLFTKAIAENLVESYHGDLPTAIVRPCLISPVWKAPAPGWIDAIQGAAGICIAVSKGFFRTCFVYRDIKIPLIPVDILSNTMIASAWHVGIKRPKDIFVVNCTLPEEKHAAFENAEIFEELKKTQEEMPLASIYRYPNVTCHFYYPLYILNALFDQWIPAFFFDILIYLFIGKTVMLPLYKKVHFLLDLHMKLFSEPWIPKLENYNSLQKSLMGRDSDIFQMNLAEFNWIDYMRICIPAARKYLGKEDPSNIPYARRKAKIWLYVTTFLKWCIILYIVYMLIPATFMDQLYHSVQDIFVN